MPDLMTILTELSWPIAICIAWVAGEFGQRLTGLPKISFYGIVGFALAAPQIGVLPVSGAGAILQLADVGFGLILFELGYRINLRWLRTNPWLGAASLLEAGTTFVAIYMVALAFGTSNLTAMLLAALGMSTSPATVVRVINETRSSGQVTERILHLTALNCVMAVFVFNVIVGFWIFKSSEDVGHAALNSVVVTLLSALAGAVFGVAVPAVLRQMGNLSKDATTGFALAVILLVWFTHTTQLSPVVAALVFGLTARHRRVAFSQAQRNFGPLGEVLTVLLFVFAASTLDWRTITDGTLLALAVLLVRLLTKTASVTAFAHLSGISWRKGALTGLGLAPVSVFVILLLEHTRLRGVIFGDELRAMAGVTLLLEIFGPILIQRALMLARETNKD
ncbi:cation:proton antiporter [Massilia sp. PAMC28688]|uniref:cation:proton antiporter n=1 Tax=Massilia sp. PAMC28688 TaxID=2861283 RepID=UPI001C628906|nr:cation:proton antiporter [Massilia sp. PAMC28688]QYF95849.1 cation:proton antiporter [Massilia sp. PAMC28688]